MKNLLQIKQNMCLLNMNYMNYQKKLKKEMSTKGLIKDLINKYSILNGAKYFSLEVLKTYLIVTSVNKYFKLLVTQLKFIRGNLMESQENSTENITTSDNTFAPTLVISYPLPNAKFNGDYLIIIF